MKVVTFDAYLEDHPIFSMTLDENYQLKRDIMVTVNTDNPGVLSTSLAHEYCQLAEILLKKKVPESQVIQWLEWLRRNGERASFLRGAPVLTEQNKELLKAYLNNPHGKQILATARGKRAENVWERLRRSLKPCKKKLTHETTNRGEE